MNLEELLTEHTIKIHLGHYENVLIKIDDGLYFYITSCYNRIYHKPLIKNGHYYTNVIYSDETYNVEVVNGHKEDKGSVWRLWS